MAPFKIAELLLKPAGMVVECQRSMRPLGGRRATPIAAFGRVSGCRHLEGVPPKSKGGRGAGRPRLPLLRTAATDIAVTDVPGIPESSAVPVTVGEEDEMGLWPLLKFVLPSCGIWIIAPVLSLVDTAVVGTRSTIELGALGPATMMCDYLAYIFTFLTIAVTNRISVCMSRRNINGAGRVVSNAMGLAFVLGVAFSAALVIISPTTLSFIAGKTSAQLVAPATAYVRLRTIGLIGFMMAQVGQGFFLASGDPGTPLLALSVAGFGNLVLDLWLVNSLGMGIRGAAIATAIAQIAAAAILVLKLYQPLTGGPLRGKITPVKITIPKFKPALDFIASCSPVIGMLMAKVVMYAMLSSIATGLSPSSSGAHHVVFSLFLFFCFVGESVSMAAQTFMPKCVGNPTKAWDLALFLQKSALSLAAFVAVGSAGVLLSCPFLFTKSPAIVAQMIKLVPFFGAVMFFHCASMMTEGVLLAGEDGHFLAKSYMCNIGACLMTVGLLRGAGLGLSAIWLTIIQFQATRLVFNWLRMLDPGSVLNRTTPLSDNTA